MPPVAESNTREALPTMEMEPLRTVVPAVLVPPSVATYAALPAPMTMARVLLLPKSRVGASDTDV